MNLKESLSHFVATLTNHTTPEEKEGAVDAVQGAIMLHVASLDQRVRALEEKAGVAPPPAG